MAVEKPVDVDLSPEEEASQQRLSKTAKIQTALEGVFTKSFQRLENEEKDVVNRYRNWKVFGDDPQKQTPAGDDVGGDSDLVVCDDVNITIQQPDSKNGNGYKWLVPLAASLVLGGLTVAGFLFLGSHLDRDTDTNTRYQVQPLPGE